MTNKIWIYNLAFHLVTNGIGRIVWERGCTISLCPLRFIYIFILILISSVFKSLRPNYLDL